MGNTLYLECNSGISGDMTAAALLDLGADQQGLLQVLNSLPVHGFRVEVSRVKKTGLDCCDFHVILDEVHENHDHDMEYLHGHTHHYHEHGEHEHCHEHHSHKQEEHEHHHEHHHQHEHRGLPEIIDIISHTAMTERAKEIAIRIFTIIAQAESKAHGEPMDKVHFHEVGAVDSIADVIAIAYCLDNLDITKVIVPYLCEGSGTIRCQHGIIPVPVPAVVNIVREHQLKLKMLPIEGELVTPTGAAVVAAVQTSTVLPEEYTIQKTGLGAGKRNYERPSILRAFLIQEVQKEQKMEHDTIYKLETNIDDCTGEQLGYVMECLFAAGAKDVYYQPIFMKKNRPAVELKVLCEQEKITKLEEIIFRETTTIGIRRCAMERHILPRSRAIVNTAYGEAECKKCMLPDGSIRYYPEYDSVRTLARRANAAYGQIVQTIQQEAMNKEDK